MRVKMNALVMIVMLLAVLASCTTFKLSGAQVTKQIPAYDSVGEFDIKVSIHEFLGASGGTNFANITAEAMDTKIYDAIQREIQKFTGDAAVNIVIEYKASFVNLLLNGFTFGLYAPATARITGTIVKYDN